MTSDSSLLSVSVPDCRQRQRRLLTVLRERQIDLAIVTLPEHIQWLAGPRLGSLFSGAAAIDADGHTTLCAPENWDGPHAADQLIPYEAKWCSTLRNDQRQVSAAALTAALAHRRPRRLGVEFSSFGPHLAQAWTAELADIEPDLYRLRRHKEADELAKLNKAIAATGKMYAVARQMVWPGVHELDVFNELQAAANREFGEMMTGTGNDYASGERGGPPRDRCAKAGELYILDLGPAYRGYYADTCRAIAVNRQPTPEQLRIWRAILPVFELVERTVKPGVSCRQLFHDAKALLDRSGLTFDHHLGHGIGLYPHEAPHLNPNWDDHFEVGDVFTCEPGLYAPELCAGIRLENDYRVTENGVALLSDFPLELA